MNCSILNACQEELEYRKKIMNSIECALKRGDEVLSKIVVHTKEPCVHINYKKFKESLKEINHENLKK